MHYSHSNIPLHPATMSQPKPLNSTSSSNRLAGDSFSGGHFFLLRDIQVLEILLAAMVFIVIHSMRQKKRYGLPVWPLFGMLPSLLFTGLRTNLYEWVTDVLRRQNWTFRFKGPWFSSLNCVVTSDPRNLEHLLKTKFAVFPKGSYFRDNLRDLLGDGIFNADDDTWQRQRKPASIEFHSAKFRNMTIESLFELVHLRLLPVLEASIEKATSIDLQDILLRLTFDNVCMIAFGVDPGCLSLSLPEIPFAKAFEDATEATVLRFVTPMWVWKTMRWLNLGMERNMRNSIKKVDEFAENVIKTRKKELSLQGDMENKRSDLLTIFMGLKDEKGGAYSDKFLRDICVNFILAGRDTSSVALSWFFWLLSENPEVEEEILREVCRIVSEREEAEGVMKKKKKEGQELRFRAEEIKRMDYLQAALSESLRLYPSVPVDHKEVTFF